LITSNEVAIAYGICHTVVIKIEAIAISTDAAVSVFFLLTSFFEFVVLVIMK
jgi:hypothetical protein